MPLRQAFTTTRARAGLTLTELLVCMTLFIGISLAMISLLMQNQKISEKNVANTDSSAKSLLLFERVRQEVRSGRVVGNPSTSELQYWIYKKVNGAPEFGGPHRLSFLPGAGSDPDLARLSTLKGSLIREFQGKSSNLANVGADGRLEFDWKPGAQILRLTGQVGDKNDEHQEKSSVRKFFFVISLNNVE